MLFGFAIETPNGTEFGLVSAEDDTDAHNFLHDTWPDASFELMDAEDIVCEQYNGLALMTAG